MSATAPEPENCPRCNGSGWIPLSSDSLRVEACGCQGDLRRRQRLAAAGIPRRYSHCTLDSFRTSTTTLKNARTRVQEFVDLYPNNHGRGLLLVGPCGSGKTHLAVAAITELISANKPGRLLFSNFQDLIQEIQASFDTESAASKSEIMQPLLEADLLVLDELGSQKPTQFVQDILYYVINTRYNDQRTTIFTTNYPDTAADARDEGLTQRIGTRLRSRLYEMAQIVSFAGADDYRKNKF